MKIKKHQTHYTVLTEEAKMSVESGRGGKDLFTYNLVLKYLITCIILLCIINKNLIRNRNYRFEGRQCIIFYFISDSLGFSPGGLDII